MKVQLDVTRTQLVFTLIEFIAAYVRPKAFLGLARAIASWHALDYNKLKIAVLELFTTSGPMDSLGVAGRLTNEKAIELSVNALRMALLRYHKQGLLGREWTRGEYRYTLTQKGAARLAWLNMQHSEAVAAN